MGGFTVKKKRIQILLCALGLTAALFGCGSEDTAQSSTSVEGLDALGDIQVIAREDGSGTRSAFAQLVDFEASGAETEQTDLTRDDAKIETTTQNVIADVEEDASAIGYVSGGALTGEENVKTLTVGGVSVEEKNYPLSRSFYIAYSGELSELEEDFLTYIHGAGQEIVGESYTSIAKSSTFLSNQASGTITVAGSTSVAPLMEALIEGYQSYNPNATITVEATDSTDGLTQAMQGSCDLGMSSRDLESYEKELLNYEIIAQDSIAVIVNADNPLEDISLDALQRIYTGDVQAWEELNE